MGRRGQGVVGPAHRGQGVGQWGQGVGRTDRGRTVRVVDRVAGTVSRSTLQVLHLGRYRRCPSAAYCHAALRASNTDTDSHRHRHMIGVVWPYQLGQC